MKVADGLQPGDVRIFEPGGSLILAIGIWAERNDARVIHIHITGGEKFHTTVTNQTSSERYHRTLFRNLRRVLMTNGTWRYGDAGAETESEDT